MKKVILVLTLLINCTNLNAQKSTLKSVKIDYEYFSTESIDLIRCEDFLPAFEKTLKSVLIEDHKSLESLYCLNKKFRRRSNRMNIRGIITFNFSNKSESFCFDSYGYFQKGNTVYKNKKLIEFIESNYNVW